jgi:hypothetical protein
MEPQPNLFPFYTFKHYLKFPRLFFNDIYYYTKYMFQRAFRGYDDRVTWDIDSYLSDMLPIWISILRDNKLGVPSVLFKPEDYTKDDYHVSDEVFEHRREEWNIILTKMIEGFKEAEILYNPYSLAPEVVTEAERKFNTAMDLLKKYYFNLWD